MNENKIFRLRVIKAFSINSVLFIANEEIFVQKDDSPNDYFNAWSLNKEYLGTISAESECIDWPNVSEQGMNDFPEHQKTSE